MEIFSLKRNSRGHLITVFRSVKACQEKNAEPLFALLLKAGRKGNGSRET